MVSIDQGGRFPNPGPRVQCFECKDIIQSMYRHDFKWCQCKNIAVDGGGDYLKMSSKPGAIYTMIDQEETFFTEKETSDVAEKEKQNNKEVTMEDNVADILCNALDYLKEYQRGHSAEVLEVSSSNATLEKTIKDLKAVEILLEKGQIVIDIDDAWDTPLSTPGLSIDVQYIDAVRQIKEIRCCSNNQGDK